MQRREFLADVGRASLGLAAFFLPACSSRTATPPKDAFLEALVAAWETGIPQWLRDTKMPAVSIAIIRGGRLAWQRAFGVNHTATNEPVDVNSPFAACSDTKPVFAYGVVKLWEKGVLDLDVPLTKYTARRVTSDPRIELITARHVLIDGTDCAKQVARRHDHNGERIPDSPVTPAERTENMARYGAAAMLMTTPGDYAKFPLEYLDPAPGDAFRLNEASRAEMLRPQIKKSDNTWEGLAWHLEQVDGIPLVFSHAGQDAGYYCFCGASTERRSGLMVMLNGDNYAPMLMKMLANPSGLQLTPENVWPDFAKQFFAA